MEKTIHPQKVKLTLPNFLCSPSACAIGSTSPQTVTPRVISNGSVSGGEEKDKARHRRWWWKQEVTGEPRAGGGASPRVTAW